jgi:hypothetical protein
MELNNRVRNQDCLWCEGLEPCLLTNRVLNDMAKAWRAADGDPSASVAELKQWCQDEVDKCVAKKRVSGELDIAR